MNSFERLATRAPPSGWTISADLAAIGRAGMDGRGRHHRRRYDQSDHLFQIDQCRLWICRTAAGTCLRGTAIGEALRLLTAWDVRAACDVLRPVYERSGKRDGRVSIEVDPRISGDAERTAAEARGLWWLVDRPNLFIKIPATRAGLPAIAKSLADGISVNVTLIFSLDRYRAVLDAFMAD